MIFTDWYEAPATWPEAAADAAEGAAPDAPGGGEPFEVYLVRYHLGLGTWLERAGFCPGATPDVAEVRRLEGLRLQSIAASGLAAVEAEALTRAVHHAADEAAFMAAHQLER